MASALPRRHYHALPPPLFVDEQPARLCARSLPWGLVAGNATACLEAVRSLQRGLAEAPLALGGRAQRPSSSSSCAVVGNSGTLLGARHGELIDSHTHVIRFNAAPTGGVWSADVGNRSTIRILSAITTSMRDPWHPKDTRQSGAALLVHCRLPRGRCLSHGTGAGDGNGRPRHLINPLFVKDEWDALVRTHPPAHHSALPSAGFVGIAIALRLCVRTSIFGFGIVDEAPWGRLQGGGGGGGGGTGSNSTEASSGGVGGGGGRGGGGGVQRREEGHVARLDVDSLPRLGNPDAVALPSRVEVLGDA